MNALRFSLRIIDKTSTWIGLAVSVLMPAMVCVLAYEVVSRYFFGKATLWAYDTAIFMFGYCGLLAGAYVQRERAHIDVDLIYARFSARGKAVLDVITGLLIFFFLILIIVYTWEPAVSAIANRETRPGEWAPPVGHFKLMIPLGAFLILLQGLANWIRSLYRAITGKEFVP
jgi:TRAP-type mannitol/chloroaromatic compound transport system permease small subunit